MLFSVLSVLYLQKCCAPKWAQCLSGGPASAELVLPNPKHLHELQAQTPFPNSPITFKTLVRRSQLPKLAPAKAENAFR